MNINRIKRTLMHCVLYPFRLLPEGGFKQKLCIKILSITNSVPLYLAVNKGDTAVQVGTPNVYTMRRFSRLVGKTGRIIIVEAEPGNAKVLESALLSMPNKNVTIVNKGAWSKPGTMKLEKSDEFKGDHKISVDDVFVDNDYRTEFSSSVEIEVDTVDNILAELGCKSIDYLSITVNGAELEVLKGATQIIDQSESCRIFSKGHARVGDSRSGTPLNVYISEFLNKHGLTNIISRGERGSTAAEHWKHREGDVFAWKMYRA